jgi:ketosteroid isomerase-like protein
MHTHSPLWSTVAVSMLVVACSSETVARPPPPPVNWQSLEARAVPIDAGKITATQLERAAGDAYLKALVSPGCTALGRLLDDDVHFAFAGYKDVHGRENVIKAHDARLGAFADRTFLATRGFLTDNWHAIEWTMTGTHSASHQPVTIRGLTLLWTKDDGSLADIHLYFDEALVNAQLGVGPKALAGLAVPSAPSSPAQSFEQARSAEEGANVATVRASLEAFEEKAEAAYLATMTDDVEVSTLESVKPARGKNEARGYSRAMHKAIAQLDTGIDNVWGIGAFVVVEYHVVGEQRGPLGFVPAQRDNLLKLFVVDVIEMQSGKIARVWRYDNPFQIQLMP